MHAKTWILDERVLLTGSANLTHNAMENNKEHAYKITDPSAVREVLEDFNKTWQDAEVVTQQHLDQMKLEKDKAEVPRRSRSKSVTRSLSVELSREGPSAYVAHV